MYLQVLILFRKGVDETSISLIIISNEKMYVYYNISIQNGEVCYSDTAHLICHDNPEDREH